MKKQHRFRLVAFLVLSFLAEGSVPADVRDLPLPGVGALAMMIPASSTGFPETIPSAYASIRVELETLASSLRAAEIPDLLLRTRMEEAARKRVQPPTLLAALRVETARLVSLAGTLRGLGLFPRNREDVTSFFGQAATLMRSGIGEQEVKAAVETAKTKTNMKSAVLLARVLAALSVVAEAEAAYRLGEGSRLRLATAMINSNLPAGGFGMVLDSLSDPDGRGESVAMALERTLKALGQGSATRDADMIQSGPGGVPGSSLPGSPGGGSAGSGHHAGPGGGPGPGTGSGGGGPGGGAQRGR